MGKEKNHTEILIEEYGSKIQRLIEEKEARTSAFNDEEKHEYEYRLKVLRDNQNIVDTA